MKYVFKKKILIFLFSIIDFIGNILFFPIRLFFNKINFPIRKILVIRLDHIGDVVASTVVLKPLREKFPDAEIDFMVSYLGSDMVKENPFIDNLIKLDPPWFSRKKKNFINYFQSFMHMLSLMIKLIRCRKYDVAIDLRGDSRHIITMFLGRAKYRIGYGITGMGFLLNKEVAYTESLHETERNMELLKPLGINDSTVKTKLYFSDEDKLISDDVKTPYAIIHPVPGHDSKKWTQEGLRDILGYIAEKGLCPILIGSEGDKRLINDIIEMSNIEIVNLAGKTSLGALGNLIKEAELFLGVDSGPAHIAASLGVATIILFSGANNPGEWAPRGDNVTIIYPGEGNPLSAVKPEEVFKKIDKVLIR